jgi:hypothetical protein
MVMHAIGYESVFFMFIVNLFNNYYIDLSVQPANEVMM